MTITYRSSGDFAEIIGAQIRRLRTRSNLTQSDLSARCGVSMGAIKNLEGGKGATLKTLIQVVRVLDRADWLEMISPADEITVKEAGAWA